MRLKKKIDEYKSSAKNNKSRVIYCVDCDDDEKFLKEIGGFCEKNHYELVWFCKNIEKVCYLGKEVSDNQKKEESKRFAGK